MKQGAVGNQQVGDLAFLDGPDAVSHAVDLGGVQREGADGVIVGKPGIERALDGLDHILRLGLVVGIEREADAGFGQRGGGTGRTLAQFQNAQGLLFLGIGVLAAFRPFQADQHRKP